MSRVFKEVCSRKYTTSHRLNTKNISKKQLKKRQGRISYYNKKNLEPKEKNSFNKK